MFIILRFEMSIEHFQLIPTLPLLNTSLYLSVQTERDFIASCVANLQNGSRKQNMLTSCSPDGMQLKIQYLISFYQ